MRTRYALPAGVHRGPDVYNTAYTLCSHCGRDFGMTCEEAGCEEPVSVIDRRHLNGTVPGERRPIRRLVRNEPAG